VFLKQHDFRLKTVTLDDYEPYLVNIEFVRFFVLNASKLETMRLNYRFHQDFTEEFYEKQQKDLLWHKKASERARLILSAACKHRFFYLKLTRVEYLDLTDPFSCDC
jgi:hypothetical protein